MTDPYLILLLSSATLGIVHTAIGVDHVIPFIALARARRWSLSQTLWMTTLCGVGHVLSSVVIASVGLGLGIATSRLEWIEATRGSWAAALLVGFGLAYAAVAFWKSRKSQFEGHAPGHVHGTSAGTLRMMPALFVIFVLGPCEALLPILTASGLTLDLWQSIWVGALFCAATLGTMLTLVTLGYLGLSAFSKGEHDGLLHRHAHALAGLSMALSGVAIQVLGI